MRSSSSASDRGAAEFGEAAMTLFSIPYSSERLSSPGTLPSGILTDTLVGKLGKVGIEGVASADFTTGVAVRVEFDQVG